MAESQSGSVRQADGGPTQSEAAAARSPIDVVSITARMRVLVTKGTDLGLVTDQLHRVLEGTAVTLVDEGPAEDVDDGTRKADAEILIEDVEYVEVDSGEAETVSALVEEEGASRPRALVGQQIDDIIDALRLAAKNHRDHAFRILSATCKTFSEATEQSSSLQALALDLDRLARSLQVADEVLIGADQYDALDAWGTTGGAA